MTFVLTYREYELEGFPDDRQTHAARGEGAVPTQGHVGAHEVGRPQGDGEDQERGPACS